MAPVVGRRTSAGFVPALPVDTRGDRARRGLTTPARMGVPPRDAAALALTGPMLALLPLRAISGWVFSEGSLMWMTGVSFGFMIPVATFVLLASPAGGGFVVTRLGPMGERAPLAILPLPLGPLRCLWAVGLAAVPGYLTPSTVRMLADPLSSGSPFRAGVTRLGLRRPAPSLGWGGSTEGLGALKPPVIATPMEW